MNPSSTEDTQRKSIIHSFCRAYSLASRKDKNVRVVLVISLLLSSLVFAGLLRFVFNNYLRPFKWQGRNDDAHPHPSPFSE